jgi:hypothetical protein
MVYGIKQNRGLLTLPAVLSYAANGTHEFVKFSANNGGVVELKE